MGKLSRLIKNLKPLSSEHNEALKSLEGIISKHRIKLIKELLSENLITIEKETHNSSIVEDVTYPKIISLSKKVDVKEVNKDIKKAAMKSLFEEFSEKAYNAIPHFIAPNIAGMEKMKKAVAIQLFAKQPIHILLLGDPGTGKTDLLRAAFNLTSISSFGLGSGTSGAGLVVTVKGSSIMKGLLPLADKGICCIDELNLMKDDSRAGLYNAMEKGFVTYDKGGSHYKFDARVKVLATANPVGDKFQGKDNEELKKELPFDSALLTRFHLTFLIKKPDLDQFKEIATSIASGKAADISKDDAEFIKLYIDYQLEKDPEDIDKNLQQEIVDFIAKIKEDESNYLIEISPRMVIGIMRMSKALALMHGRTKVKKEDIDEIKNIIEHSLKIA